MLNNGNKISCGFENTIVSYVYDEVDSWERQKFEGHLSNCLTCTDEFVSIATARFSVFEWRKEEFAHLATPEILLPYAKERQVAERNAPVGFVDSLRSLLTGIAWPATVVTALLVVLGVGFAALTFVDSKSQKVAGNVSLPSVTLPDTVAADEIKSLDENRTLAVDRINAGGETRHVEAPVNLRPKVSRQLTAQTQKSLQLPVSQEKIVVRRAPVLSSYDENEDKSLRLSDLFDDEIGSGG